MRELIVVTREELEEIIDTCLSRYLPKMMEPAKQPDDRLLYSIRELADFLGCSTVTVQKLKNSGKIRYRQYGRKLIFNTAEILADLDNKHWKQRREGDHYSVKS